MTLLVVLAACAGVRIWLIANTIVLANDSAVYVKMARQWSHTPVQVVAGYDYPPGYPVAVNWLHRARRVVGLGGDDEAAWNLSAQIVSLLASMAAMVAVYLFAKMVFQSRTDAPAEKSGARLCMDNGNIPAITVLLFGLGRKWAVLGADALSDSLAVCFQMWAAVLALQTLRTLRRGKKRSVALGGCAGLCSALGYLVRPEALLAGALAAMLWVGWQLRDRKACRLTLATTAVALVVMLACSWPYMAAVGGLTKKKHIDDFIGPSAAQRAPSILPASQPFPTPAERRYGPFRELTNQLFEAIHPLVGFVACFYLGAWISVRFLGVRPRMEVFPAPNTPGGFMMIAATTVMAGILTAMYVHTEYIRTGTSCSSRRCLPPLPARGWLSLRPLWMRAWPVSVRQGASGLRLLPR
ncbi:MAG: hypothetical protein J7M14_00825 [Planctomycetes bacterium]|nr:hypothetical protein [Planctomycetota bacterium]